MGSNILAEKSLGSFPVIFHSVLSMHCWYRVWGIVYLWQRPRVCIWVCSSMQMPLLTESIAAAELTFETEWDRSLKSESNVRLCHSGERTVLQGKSRLLLWRHFNCGRKSEITKAGKCDMIFSGELEGSQIVFFNNARSRPPSRFSSTFSLSP